MRHVPNNVSELSDYIGFLVLACPDRFPPDRELDLEGAFLLLQSSLCNLRERLGALKYESLRRTGEVAEELFERGDSREGRFLLQAMGTILKRK